MEYFPLKLQSLHLDLSINVLYQVWYLKGAEYLADACLTKTEGDVSTPAWQFKLDKQETCEIRQ